MNKVINNIQEIEKGLNQMSEEVSTSVPVRNGRQINAGDVIEFNIVDEDGKVLAGEEPIPGTTYVNKVLACTRNGKDSTINFGELLRYVYATEDDEELRPVCPVCEDNFKAWSGMTMNEILMDLAGKSFTCIARVKAWRKKFGTDEKDETTVAVFVTDFDPKLVHSGWLDRIYN